jgi:leucyl aminopeptidase (aminopeptidase T)
MKGVMMENDLSLIEGVRKAVKQCMGVKPGEVCLIVTDDKLFSLAEYFFQISREQKADTLMITMAPRSIHGEEPPAPIQGALLGANCAFLITSASMTHTKARGEATKAGVRIASMPGLTADMIRGPLNVDYDDIVYLSKEMTSMLDQASQAILMSERGTNITFDLSGRRGITDSGIIHQPGNWSNLPAGESYIAPIEGKASGTLVIDGMMAGIGILKEPIVAMVSEGRFVNISGGEEALKLKQIISAADENAGSIAELGIGTNRQATLMGAILVDEKVFGTVHVAIGNNAFMGGVQNSKIHLDGVILKPTLILDGKVVIDKGEHIWS